MWMNPPTFHGIKLDEDQESFIEKLFKVVDGIGETPREKEELASYQLKDVAQVWLE